MGRPMYEESIRDEFTHQSDAFARAPVMSSAETLGALVELVPADPEVRRANLTRIGRLFAAYKLRLGAVLALAFALMPNLPKIESIRFPSSTVLRSPDLGRAER